MREAPNTKLQAPEKLQGSSTNFGDAVESVPTWIFALRIKAVICGIALKAGLLGRGAHPADWGLTRLKASDRRNFRTTQTTPYVVAYKEWDAAMPAIAKRLGGIAKRFFGRGQGYPGSG